MFARPSHVTADAAAVAAGQSAAAVAAADHTMVSQSAPFPCLGAAAPDRVTISLLVSAPSLPVLLLSPSALLLAGGHPAPMFAEASVPFIRAVCSSPGPAIVPRLVLSSDCV